MAMFPLSGLSAGALAKILIPIAIVLGVLLVALAIYNKGESSGTAKRDVQTLEGSVETLENTAAANENAAAARLADADRQAKEKAERERVTKNAETPADRRRAFHRCLREQQSARASGRPAPVCG